MGTIEVNRLVSVDTLDITRTDIENMNSDQLKAYAIDLNSELRLKHPKVRHDNNRAQIATNDAIAVNTTEPATNIKEKLKTHKGGNHICGTKKGKTSMFHYVWYNQRLKSWNSGLTLDKRKIVTGVFEKEIDAAIAVDTLLDHVNDTKRPRNRYEFAEILEAHQKQLREQFQAVGGAI
jgi:hypothetical protein